MRAAKTARVPRGAGRRAPLPGGAGARPGKAPGNAAGNFVFFFFFFYTYIILYQVILKVGAVLFSTVPQLPCVGVRQTSAETKNHHACIILAPHATSITPKYAL